MKLYNTLSRKVETLEPLSPPQVTLYTCGPTVYLEPTIGNWRAFIFYDQLVRALKLEDFKIKRVMNITDVGHLVSDADEGQDKMEVTAKKQRQTAWEIAETVTKLFRAEMKLLRLLKPTHLLRATEHIKEQILLLEILDKKGFTYKTSDGVYFDTSKLDDYGKLVGNLKGHKAGARVSVNKAKRNPRDFALWKFTPKGVKRDMEWDSPWGKGWPGWHLECSAMALQYLGKTLDIHAGGVDHIGTHHTNEIAQSEAATGEPFAKIWIHNEFLLVDGAKMAKSAGNYYTLSDLIKKGYQPLAFKLLVLQAHYRKQLNFTWKALDGARAYLFSLYALADRAHQTTSIMDSESAAHFTDLLAKSEAKLRRALSDDLDTPAALAALEPVISYVATNPIAGADEATYKNWLGVLDKAFGLGLAERPDLETAQKELIKQREDARTSGEFKEADKLRDELKSQNIVLNDNEFGVTWAREAAA